MTNSIIGPCLEKLSAMSFGILLGVGGTFLGKAGEEITKKGIDIAITGSVDASAIAVGRAVKDRIAQDKTAYEVFVATTNQVANIWRASGIQNKETARLVAKTISMNIDRIEFPIHDVQKIAEQAGSPQGLHRALAKKMLENIPDPWGNLKDELAQETAQDIFTEAIRAGIAASQNVRDEIMIALIDKANFYLRELVKKVDEIGETTKSIDKKAEGIYATATRTEMKLDESIALSQQIDEKLTRLLEEKGKSAGLNDNQIKAVLTSFGHENIPPELWEIKLLESAQKLKDLETQLRALSNDEPEIASLMGLAADAIENGDIAKADEYLKVAVKRDIEAGARRMTRAAENIAKRGELAMSGARYLEAAEFYEQAADYIKPHFKEKWGEFMYNVGFAYWEYGKLVPGEYLIKAKIAYENVLIVHTQKDMPAQWAQTQNNLGIVLCDIGARQSGEKAINTLNAAKTAYEKALKVYTQKDIPTDWAQTQNNLGIVLRNIGARQSGEDAISSLNAAKTAFENALIVRTQKNMTNDWAMTQNNHGNVLSDIGARQSGEDAISALNAAKIAYENALIVYTQKDMPAQWAGTQNNLGNVLLNISESQSGEEAINSLIAVKIAFEKALTVYTQKGMPAQWAMTQNNLGNVLRNIGARQSGEDAINSFNAAKPAFENALKVCTQKDMPAQWAMINENLAILSKTIFEKNGDKQELLNARQFAENAMTIYSQGGMEYYAKGCQNLLNLINQLLE